MSDLVGNPEDRFSHVAAHSSPVTGQGKELFSLIIGQYDRCKIADR